MAVNSLKIAILNFAYNSFSKIKYEPDPEIFEEKLDEVRDEILDLNDSFDDLSKAAFEWLEKNVPFFRYL